MVYLWVKKEQLGLEPAYPFVPVPAFHQQLLEILPLPLAPGCKTGFRTGRSQPPVMEPANVTVVVGGTLECPQAPDVAIHVFSHNGYRVADFSFSFNYFYNVVNAKCSLFSPYLSRKPGSPLSENCIIRAVGTSGNGGPVAGEMCEARLIGAPPFSHKFITISCI